MKTVEVKEVKLRPAIDKHDLRDKMKHVKRFFDDGSTMVKITLPRFAGSARWRTRTFGLKLLERVKQETQDFAKVEVERSSNAVR